MTVTLLSTSVPRRPMPVIEHNFDSQAEAVQALPFAWTIGHVYTTTMRTGNLKSRFHYGERMSKPLCHLSEGATSVIVPKTAVPYIKTQLYDYPYIDRTHRVQSFKDQPWTLCLYLTVRKMQMPTSTG
jgi:hypothetical protein